MVKVRKVYTPGSRPAGRGRPKKAKERKGTARKGNYRNKYNQAMMDMAIRDIEEKRLSLNKAAKKYNVPKATLSNRLTKLTTGQLGRPTELSKEEEEIMVERLIMLGDWGFPLSCKDLCYLIKAYLDSSGRATRKVENMDSSILERDSCMRFEF